MADPELEDLRKQCVTKLYICTDNVLKYLKDEKEDELAALKSHLETYCLHEAEQNVLEQVSEKVKKESDASNIDTIEERFNNYLKTMSKKLEVKNHPWVVKLHKMIKKANEDQNLDESDLAITDANDAYIDPITKRAIQDPVRNTFCGHTYERESIISLINNRKKKTLCPVMGCGNKTPIQEKHLVPDEEARYRMTQMVTQNTSNQIEINSIDDSMEIS